MTTKNQAILPDNRKKNSSKDTTTLNNGIQAPLDTEQEFISCVDGAIEDLQKERMKSYKLEKMNKNYEDVLNELKEENDKLAGKIRYAEANRESKSQRRQNIVHILSKAGEALPDEFKQKCDAEMKECLQSLRAKYLSNKF
jgi:hypothetical protein